MSENQRLDTAGDLRRIHGIITHTLHGALAQSERFAHAGPAGAEARQALVDYMRCLAQMLHDHHLTEDHFVFPYLQDRRLDAPYGALMAHHVEMQSLLDEIQATCDILARDEQDGETAQGLHDALDRLCVLWHPHIQIEEAHFAPPALVGMWNPQEAAQFGAAVEAYVQQHIDPDQMRACQEILSAAR